MRFILLCFITMVICHISFNVSAEEGLLYDLHINIDESQKVNPQNSSNGFIPIENFHVHVPYTDATVWLKGKIAQKKVTTLDRYYLVLTSPLSGKLTLFLRDRGDWQEQAQSGSSIEWDKRDVSTYYGAFNIPNSIIENGADFLIKREGHHLLDAELKLLSSTEFQKIDLQKTYLFIFYGDAVFALLIYNMFLFFYGKEKIYGIYVAFLISLGGAAATSTGAMDSFLRFGFVSSDYLLLFSSAATALSIIFTRYFIDFKTYVRKVDPLIKWLPVIPISIFFIYVFFHSSPLVRAVLGTIIDIVIPLVLLILIISSIMAFRKGSPLAKFYLLSWAVLTGGVFYYLAGLHGFVKDSALSQSAILLGNLGEMLLLSVALAHRMTQMEAAKKEMELNVKEKERYKRLVRVLCHDIANPLSIITSYAQLIVKKKEISPEKNHAMAEKIQKASSIIEELLIRVRNYESLDVTKRLKLFPVYLKHVMSEAEFLLQEKLNEKNIQLEYDKTIFDCWVLAERSSLLNNVIVNVLTNSIKFSDLNSVININIAATKDKVTLNIIDHGVGISRTQIDEFELKGQIESRRGTVGEVGTGLGMGLMKSYMKMYNGEIHISSTPRNLDSKNSGTIVTLTFARTE